MTIRTERVGELIRQEIAGMLMRGELHDPRLAVGVISLSGVRMSRDLQHALVYVSVLEPDAVLRESVLAGLNRAAGFVRGQLGKRLQMRYTPKIRFESDTTIEQGARMEALLASLSIPPASEDDTATRGEK